jgi:hypothetical protein
MKPEASLRWPQQLGNCEALGDGLQQAVFIGEELLAPRPNPQLEDHTFSDVHDCLLNIFIAILHFWRPSPPPATWGCAQTDLWESELWSFVSHSGH